MYISCIVRACPRDPRQAVRPRKQVFLTATRRSFSHIIEQKRHVNTLTNRHLFSAISLAVPPHQEEVLPRTKPFFTVLVPKHPEEPVNRIMEKRMFPGVRKKRPIKRNKKKLLNKVLDYLTSDSYMFAPLVARPPSGFSSSVKKRASLRGVEVKTPVREKKRLLEKLSDYLKSNCYMYAPLLALPQSIIPPKGSSLYLERVTTVEASERRLILKGYKPTEKLADAIVEDQASKGSLPEEIISKQQSSVHKETVKHLVCNSCRSSSMSGKGMLGSQIRKLVD